METLIVSAIVDFGGLTICTKHGDPPPDIVNKCDIKVSAFTGAIVV
jgi:hypothetical protein